MSDIVITGIGVVTPIGVGADAMWRSILEGRSGAGPVTAFDSSSLPVHIACEASEFDPADFIDRRELGRTDRFTHMAMAASAMAIENAGWDSLPYQAERVGCIIGTGIGGISTIEHEHQAMLKGGPRRVSPFMVPKLMPNGAASAVSMKQGLKGPSFAPTSACASGGHSIGEALRILRSGWADAMLAGGTEAALTPLAMAAFARMGALSTRNDEPEKASRPFDANRDGFVFGEGAGVVILETREGAEKRGHEPLAVLAGYGATSDAHHVTQPDPEGRGAAAAMEAAMSDAGIEAGDIDYVNAHGTSTPYNDRVETIAIKRALGNEAKRVAISSTKSQTGHLLGAAGAVEAAICALSIHNDVIPATINLTDSDPDCDLDYVPREIRQEKVDITISNSFGFGGQNACLVLKSV
jgi:3-oxoacyl-[acyl-carrier-protein] synthase II